MRGSCEAEADLTLLRPTTLSEACQALSDSGDGALLLAGGTAIEVLRKLGLVQASTFIDIMGIPELDGIEVIEGGIRIGAIVTHRQIEKSPIVCELAPVLADAFGQVANVRVRNAATIGGNLCYADYRIDPPAALLALGARVELESASERRSLALQDFFLGPEQTARLDDEILVAVQVPRQPAGSRAVFRKATALAENDWPCAAVAVRLSVGEAGPSRMDVGLTAAAPAPRVFSFDVSGLSLAQALRVADGACAGAVDPIADVRGSREFKAHTARVTLQEAVEAVWPADPAP
jgi:carbon-monoxide dehydrogenase medium subunit